MFDVESVAWLLLLGNCAMTTKASGAKTKGVLKNTGKFRVAVESWAKKAVQ